MMLRGNPASYLLLACALAFRTTPEISPQEIYNKAVEHLRDGDFENSAKLLDRPGAPTVGREYSEWFWRFRALRAEVFMEQNRSNDALALLNTNAPAEEDNPEFAITRRILQAKYEMRQSRFTDAFANLQAAVDLADRRNLGELRTEADLLIGQILARQGKMDQASETFRRARQQAADRKDSYREAQALTGLGLLLMMRSRCDEAIPLFEQSRTFTERIGADLRTAGAANNLGMCYAQLGDFERAISYREQAMKLARPSARLAEVLGETGTSYLAQGNQQEAIRYYRRALTTAQQFGVLPEAARWAGNLTAALVETRDWDGAEAALEQALALKPEPRSRAFLDLNAAAVARGRGRLDQARSIYETTLIASAAMPVVAWQAHFGLALVWSELKQTRKADQHFEAALRLIEENQSSLSRSEHKITFLGRLISFYQAYVNTLMVRGDPVAALSVADSSRARIMAERFSLPSSPRNSSSPGAFQRTARDSGSIWLSYWLGPQRSFLWVVTGSGIRSFVLPPAAEITKLVEAYQGFIEGSMRDPMVSESDAGRKLYESLIAPAASLIPSGARVVIVPDGALHRLNFETLPVYTERPHYWIDDVTVAVAPSLGIYQEAQDGTRDTSRHAALLIGDPVLVSTEYPRLPYAGVEIARIRNFVPADSRVMVREAAHPQAYKHANPSLYSMIHISAHAEVKRDSPLDSAIILSPSTDGYKLYARDVMDVPLKAGLVTLSACRTSGARAYSGEGFVGFAWAFLRAGAHSVVAGLWDVVDESTAEIMDGMYAGLKQGASPVAALRQAKLNMRTTRYSKPYYWGPFQCYVRTGLKRSATDTIGYQTLSRRR